MTGCYRYRWMIIYTCRSPWTYWEKFWMTGPSNDLQRACTRSQAARLLVSTSIKYTTWQHVSVHICACPQSHVVSTYCTYIDIHEKTFFYVSRKNTFLSQKIQIIKSDTQCTCITYELFKSEKSNNIALLYKNNIKKHEHVSVCYLILQCLSWCIPLDYPQTAPHQHL